MQSVATGSYCIRGLLLVAGDAMSNLWTARWTEPSWTQRAPHRVQNARRIGPITTTMRTDWQTGHLAIMTPPPSPTPAGAGGAEGNSRELGGR